MATQNEVRKNVEAMQSVAPEIVKLLKNYRTKAKAAYRDINATDPAKAAKAVAAREEAREQLAELREQLNVSYATVKAGVAEMEKKHDEAAERTSSAHESRVSRAWERTRRLLDSGENVIAILNDAAERGDAPTLHALWEEAEAHFTAEGNRVQGEEVRAKAKELRAVVEGGLLGEAAAAAHVAATAEDWSEAPIRDAGNELEGGQPVKDVYLQGGDIVSLRDDRDIAERVASDAITHRDALREAANG